MDAIEKAIRNAFEKGDPRERAFREKVYRSAFGALERALQANPNLPPEVVEHRRTQLGRRISEIETEFLPAVREPEIEPGTVPEVGIDGYGGGIAAPAPTVEPRYERRDPGFGASSSGTTRGATSGDEIEPPTGEGKPRRGRPWAAMMIGVTLLSAAAIGTWWALDTGLFRTPAERDQSVPNPPQVTEEEDFSPDGPSEPPQIPGTADTLDDWIVVFEPTDPTTVTAPGDSSAEAMEADGVRFMRIKSGPSGSPVLFDVGQGVLEQLAGKRAVFAIVARALEGAETEMSVDCNLGELGDCGRKRYAVGVTREDFLFEIDLPAADPGAGGTIAINPDFEGSGRGVDIFAIRVTEAQ